MRLARAPKLNANARAPTTKRKLEGDVSGKFVQSEQCIDLGCIDNNGDELQRLGMQQQKSANKK